MPKLGSFMPENTNSTPPTEGKPSISPTQKRGMILVIAAQCFGGFGGLLFARGIILLYLLALGIPETRALFYLTVESIGSLFGVFFAHIAGRVGLKKIGTPGLLLGIIGILLIACASIATDLSQRESFVLAGIICFSIGGSAMAGTWFPLLRPIIPEHVRGRFFGILRFTWQLVGVGLIALCGLILRQDSSTQTYFWILIGTACLLSIRLVIYLRIPEIDQLDPKPMGFMSGIINAITWPRYLPLITYVLLLSSVTAGSSICFTMTESKTLLLADSLIVFLGNISLIGGVIGFILGGSIIDKWGSRPVFVIAHLAAGCFMISFVLRGVIPIPTTVWLGFIHFGMGLIMSSVSVAITTEQLITLPNRGKSIAIALSSAASLAGTSLSGFIVAILASSGMLAESWSLFGTAVGPYDAILLLFSGAVLILTITLGLIPSVLPSKHQLLPQT